METSLIKNINTKKLVLDNGLKVVLIQKCSENRYTLADGHHKVLNEATTEGKQREDSFEKGAAALCIGVGSFCDPVDLLGLSYLLEKTILLGSEKYTEEDHYNSFIHDHGGNCYSSTNCEHTTFNMEVPPQHFEEALDIFTSCFKSPLFRTDSVDGAIEKIETEYSWSTSSSIQCYNYILASIAQDGHPMSKYHSGNKLSLKDEPIEKGIDVHAELRKFYDQYYSAHNMTLAVWSPESLQNMEDLVKKYFSDIRNNGLPIPSFGHLLNPFKTESFYKIYKVQAPNDMHILSVKWALPPSLKHYRTKPVYILEHVVDYEGEGSIFSFLRKRHWAKEFWVATLDTTFGVNNTGTVFDIIIILTEKGMENIHEVLTAVFQYTDMLQKIEQFEAYFTELKTVNDAKIQFRSETMSPSEFVRTVVENVQNYDLGLSPDYHFGDYQGGDCLLYDYDPKIISTFVHLLKPELANIAIMSPQFTEDDVSEVEKWTNAKYSVSDIPEDWLEKWKNLDKNDELHFPLPSNFISTNFDLKWNQRPASKHPVKLVDDDFCCVWFKGDSNLKAPEAYIQLVITFPKAYESAQLSVKFELFERLINYNLEGATCQANAAGLYYCINTIPQGFTIYLYGFNEKIALLLELIIDNIFQFEVDEQNFECMKDEFFNTYKYQLNEPSSLARNISNALVLAHVWPCYDERNALLTITTSSLNAFIKECLSSCFVLSYFHGNLLEEEVITMNGMIRSKTQHVVPCDKTWLKEQVLKIPDIVSVSRIKSFDDTEKTSAVCNYYELGLYNPEASCRTEIFNMLMKKCALALEKEFDNWYSWLTLRGGVCAIIVECSSSKFSVSYMDESIDKFLKNLMNEMFELKEEKFQNQVKKLIADKKDCDLYVNEIFEVCWEEILSNRFVFDRRELEVKSCENLTLKDFQEWVNGTIETALNKKTKLCVQVVGSSDEILNGERNNENETSDIVEEGSGEKAIKECKINLDEAKEIYPEFLIDRTNSSKDICFITNVNDFKDKLNIFELNVC